MKVELLGPLKREIGAGEIEIKLESRMKLTEALKRLPKPLRRRVLEASGRVLPGILVVVNGLEVGAVGSERVYVGDEDEIALIPVIHGGGAGLELAEFEGRWVAAAVRRAPREEALKNPVALLERAGAGGEAVLQLFDARPIISHTQIHAAALAAELAFKAGLNIARSRGMEVLVRLAADTQIGRALERIGVREGCGEVGFCAVAGSREEAEEAMKTLSSFIGGIELSEDELHAEERVKRALEFYGIGEELETIQAKSRWEAALLLILERIASADLER